MVAMVTRVNVIWLLWLPEYNMLLCNIVAMVTRV